MPTYEYLCRACGHGFDIVQSFKDESLTICPACGGELRKVYAPPAISFKGSGFYATDSRRSSDAGSESKTEGSKDPKAADAKDRSDAGGSKDEKGAKGSEGSSTSPEKRSEKRPEERSEKRSEPTTSGSKGETSGTKKETPST